MTSDDEAKMAPAVKKAARIAVEDQLMLPHVEAWRAWLDSNESESDGVWLIMAKKGVTDPTSITYAEALDEALCSGWIDGQRKTLDERTFLQRYTPRRSASVWSQRNVVIVAELASAGRMRPRGAVEIERAKADGRWDRAYAGPASIQVPPDLAAALDASPGASARFAELNKTARYSVIHPVVTAATATTRANRIARAIAKLEQPQ